MGGRTFLNYRRNDDPGYTQALFQFLEQEFPVETLFMDVEGDIRPGDDFVEVLAVQVQSCDVFLAIIGPRWEALLESRQGDPGDFVVIEIQSALEQGKRVIPVLVGGADMPHYTRLPASIRSLARRNAVTLRPASFKRDCQALVTGLRALLAEAHAERKRAEADSATNEAKRRRLEADEASGLASLGTALTKADLQRAEELENWAFLKRQPSEEGLRDRLARFAQGPSAPWARAALEDVMWKRIGPSASAERLQAFLDEFPEGLHAKAARDQLVDASEGRAVPVRVNPGRRRTLKLGKYPKTSCARWRAQGRRNLSRPAGSTPSIFLSTTRPLDYPQRDFRDRGRDEPHGATDGPGGGGTSHRDRPIRIADGRLPRGAERRRSAVRPPTFGEARFSAC